jgi:hypothetical protein
VVTGFEGQKQVLSDAERSIVAMSRNFRWAIGSLIYQVLALHCLLCRSGTLSLSTDLLSTTHQSLPTVLSSSSRRSFVSNVAAATMSMAISTAIVPTSFVYAFQNIRDIERRLSSESLSLPEPTSASELKGIDNTYYPLFLQGEWDVTQTLVDTQAPLGLKYLGGPNGNMDIATKSFEGVKSKLNVPIQLRLRYIPTKWGVAEDRRFNNQARLDAFAGKSVVASVQYADVGGCNRKSILAQGGSNEDPLQTTVTYFKGPAAQKSFLISHGCDTLSESSWTGYEVLRSIFSLTNTNMAPPITTDVEYIWKFEKINDTHVQGKLRIAEYLNAQSDVLYFDAHQRAVSFQDYLLDMRRVKLE